MTGGDREIVVRALGEDDWHEFGPRIAEIERRIDYPLGDRRFCIDHGTDYFAFFRRMGKLCYLVATLGDEILGMLAAIERPYPCVLDEAIWYLGDLKVVPGAEGRMLARRLLRSLRDHIGWRSGYGISMNPGNGGANRIARLVRRLRLGVETACLLNLFSLDAEEMTAVLPLVEQHRGPLGFLSLRGAKDIVMTDTGEPMPLLHVQFGPCAESCGDAPQKGSTHMFCAPCDDPLDIAIRKSGLRPTATATVLHLGMQAIDWKFVLTSDI